MQVWTRISVFNSVVSGALLLSSGSLGLKAQTKDNSLLDSPATKEAVIYAPQGLPFEQSKLGEDQPDPNAGLSAQQELILDSILSARDQSCLANLTEQDLIQQAEAAVERIYGSQLATQADAQVLSLQRELTMNAVRRQIANRNCNEVQTK